MFFASSVLEHTSAIAVGPNILNTGLRHPQHVAEQAALTGSMHPGRVTVVAGAGYVPSEFATFGVPRDERMRFFGRSVSGPRGVEVAARHADGWMIDPVSSIARVEKLAKLYRSYCAELGSPRRSR